jgi:hypothetical protein
MVSHEVRLRMGMNGNLKFIAATVEGEMISRCHEKRYYVNECHGNVHKLFLRVGRTGSEPSLG